MASKAEKQEQAQNAADRLRELLQPGDTVYTTVSHVTGSGMTRWIRVFVMKDNEPRDVSWWVAKVTDSPVNTRNHEGVERGGAGMDMGFDLVYSLSRVLFRDRFECIGENCPSNDHSNRRAVAPGEQHSDAGYALRQRWL